MVETTWIFGSSNLHRGNEVDYLTSKITSKNVRGNNVDFLNSQITSQKVRGNDVDFSISEIISKKYVEMTWRFVKICSSTYQRNIEVESTWIRCGVPVGLSMLLNKYIST